MNEVENAIDCFQQSIQIEPNDADYHNDLGYAFYYKMNFTEAMSCFEEAIRLNPKKAEAYNGYGLILADRKKTDQELKQSIEYFNKAIEADSSNALFYRNKGIAFYSMKMFQSAVDCFTQAISNEPSNCELYLYNVEALKNLSMNKEAKICYKKARQLKPDSHELTKHWLNVNKKLLSLFNEEEIKDLDHNLTATTNQQSLLVEVT